MVKRYVCQKNQEKKFNSDPAGGGLKESYYEY
jgi:hypothetical protein